jgi:ATP-binding cassette subfamily B protein
MYKTSPALSLTMIPLLLITSTVIIFFGVKMEPMFRTVQQKLDQLNTVLQENIAGARLVKAYVRADYENEHFELANQDLAEHTIKVMQFMSTMSPVLSVFINLGMVLVIWSGGLQAIQGNMTIGQIVAFTNYLLITMTPLIMMTMLSNTWANGIASAKRVNEVLDTIPDVLEKEKAKSLPDQTKSEVVFNEVSFHYNGSSEGSILKDINLLTKPGETVAILGSTGSGKSSLVNLIPRFYDVTSGQILIGGMDVRDLKEDSLLSHIGFVPQETILFSGTIRENICYGFPQATDEEVIAAAKAAQAHDFINKYPKGYDSHVEERGNNLSGGQKQRIAIARAIILHPMILILDDSTSSVDVETEIKIQTALAKMMRGQTSFIVAQRISTVLNADKIIVIDKGRIAAQGTHAYLIKTSPIYQEIYDSQLGNGFQMTKSKKTRRDGSQS